MKRHPSIFRRGFHRTVAIVGAIILVLVAGCSSGTERSADDSLTIATSFEISDLDPLENSFWGPEFGYVELLMRPEPDGNPSPWVLESLERKGDRTWLLGLRDDVTFVNGRALDAEALVQLIAYMDEHNEGFRAAANVKDVAVQDATTVRLTTKVPVPAMPNLLADESQVPVFDVDAYESHLASGDDASALLEAGLYTGPYRMTSLNDRIAELEPVKQHWDGPPALDSLTIKFVPEPSSRVQAVQAGEADIALYMPTEIARTLKDRNDAFYVEGEPANSTFSVQLRDAGPYSDTRVRRALLAGIDYRELAEDVLDGHAGIATSAFGPTLPYAIDTQATDVTAAAALLDEAGWTMDDDLGFRRKGGRTLSLRLLSYPQQPDSNTIAIALQSQLKELGIEVTVSNVPDLTAAREGTEWDAAIVGDSLLSFSMSPEAGLRSGLVTGGSQNFMKISDAELDGLVETLSATFDEADRIDLMKDIQRLIAAKGLWAATVRRVPAVVTNEEWKGYQPPIANLWVTSETSPRA